MQTPIQDPPYLVFSQHPYHPFYTNYWLIDRDGERIEPDDGGADGPGSYAFEAERMAEVFSLPVIRIIQSQAFSLWTDPEKVNAPWNITARWLWEGINLPYHGGQTFTCDQAFYRSGFSADTRPRGTDFYPFLLHVAKLHQRSPLYLNPNPSLPFTANDLLSLLHSTYSENQFLKIPNRLPPPPDPVLEVLAEMSGFDRETIRQAFS